MHNRRVGILAASMMSMFAGLGGSVPMASTSGGTLEAAELASLMAPSRRRSRGPGRKNIWKKGSPSAEYLTRQLLRTRYHAGQKVPKDVVAAMEAHAARRAPINERRAYAARRQEEGKVLRDCMDAYVKAADAGIPSSEMKNTAERARRAVLFWNNRQPFPAELMGA